MVFWMGNHGNLFFIPSFLSTFVMSKEEQSMSETNETKASDRLQQEPLATDTPRVRILRGASRLMHQRGIRVVTMDDVATEVGMSKRTIYALFVDKEALVRAVLMEDPKRMPEDHSGVGDSAMNDLLHLMQWGWRYLRAIDLQFFVDLRKLYPGVAQEYSLYIRQVHFDHIVTLLRRGAQEGVFLPDLDFEALAKMFIECGAWLGNRAVFSPEHFTLDRLMRTFLSVFANGIATEAGRQAIAQYLESHAWLQ